MLLRNALALLVSMLFAVGVATADAPTRKEGPCAADVKKLCPGVKPGEGRIHQCMTSHEAEISPACREVIGAVKAKLERMAQVCKTDWEKYCKSIPPGDGRILSCLKGQEVNLEPACAAEFRRVKNNKSAAQ
jgi:hypothetical protein